jgi:hypothetical protein
MTFYESNRQVHAHGDDTGAEADEFVDTPGNDPGSEAPPAMAAAADDLERALDSMQGSLRSLSVQSSDAASAHISAIKALVERVEQEVDALRQSGM